MRFAMPRVVFALLMREMNTTYGRSAMGYVWAVLEPIAAIGLLSVIFSIAFRSPALGVSFPLFYAAGYLPFMYFTDTSIGLAQSIRFSRQLLFYPRVTFVDALLARLILKTLTHGLVFLVVISGIQIFSETRVVIQFEYIFSAFAMAGALAIGVGVLNCLLFEILPAWERMWSIVTRPLFILSGILFTIESVPEPYRSLLLVNPLTQFVSEMRRGFYPYYDGKFTSYLYVYGIALVMAAAGFLLLKRYSRKLLDG